MRVLGIDPGKNGAVSFYDGDENEIVVQSLPWSDEEKRLDGLAFMRMIDGFRPIDLCVVEQVGAMPGQGVTSTFTFGKAYGSILGVCDAAGLNVHLVSPLKWKNRIMDKGKHGKKDAVRLCYAKFPEVSLMRTSKSRVADHNMAESVLIALYGNLFVECEN